MLFAPLVTKGQKVRTGTHLSGSPVVIYFRSDDDVASVSSTVRRELIRGDGSAVPIGTLWLDKGYGGEEGPSSSTVTR